MIRLLSATIGSRAALSLAAIWAMGTTQAQELVGESSVSLASGRVQATASIAGYFDTGRAADFFVQIGITNHVRPQSLLVECPFFDSLDSGAFLVDRAACNTISANGGLRLSSVAGQLTRELGDLSVELRVRGLTAVASDEFEVVYGLGNSVSGELIVVEQIVGGPVAISSPPSLWLTGVGLLSMIGALCRQTPALTDRRPHPADAGAAGSRTD